ncbi:MAG: sugar phosphate nucleotidyltransferase [Flavobacteriales bacterium]
MNNLDAQLLHAGATIKEALEKLNAAGKHLNVFVVDTEGRLLGSISDGDIRRGLLSGHDLAAPVAAVMFKSPRSLMDGAEGLDLLDQLRERGIKLLPILDAQGRVLRIADLDLVKNILPVDALVMAGGRGERLRPFTDELPKPLIPVGQKPIIEHTLGLLARFGVQHVAISVNYLREKIMDHLGDGSRFGMHITYVHEDAPLGTAGALALLGAAQHGTLLMMNSDLLTDVALDRMYKRFLEADADLAVATTDHHVSLPYAVMELDGDRVRSFREKPSLAYPCNAGIYMMRRSVAATVPKGRAYNATDLIQNLLDNNRKLIAFPITGYWLDIGQHEDLQRARRDHSGPK